MSAKRSTVAPLPPEIHLTILKAALEVPSDFDLELFRQAYPKKLAERTFRARLVSSRHFLRVCRRWHDFALPLFYETVWVSKLSQIESLMRRFRTQRRSYIASDLAASTSNPLPLISSCVKRLVFTPSLKRNAQDHHPILKLALLCSSTLVSLHMLTMIPHRPTDSPDPDNGRSEQFIQDLSGLRNLEVLNVSIVWPYPSLRTVWSAIDGMKRLDVLRIDGLTWPLEYFAKLVQNTKLRKLTIAAPYSYSTSPDLHIQTLDEVAFLGVYVNPVDFPKFSSNVGRLTLQMGSAWSLANLLSSDWLNVHFNHITRLDLLVPKWGDLGDASATSRVTLPGGLAHLGLIATRKYQGSRREYLALKDFCAAVALGAAQIGAVQILSRQTCVDLARRHTVVLAQIIDVLCPSQIILLDYEGKGFALP